MGKNILEIKDLYVSYKTDEGVFRAVNGLDFAVEAGEEREYLLEVLQSHGEFEMEVRSATPGVRPSRGIFVTETKGGDLHAE